MNYSFFLFGKLFDVYHTTEIPYDILFGELSAMYEDWISWDVENGKNTGEYESMCKYISSHVPAFDLQ